MPGGGWLPPDQAAELLRGYGVPLADLRHAHTIDDGTEVVVGVTDDHMFGPLVMFGLGGVATEVLADHSARARAADRH